MPPWESAGGSDVPPWEELPPDLPLIGPYGSDAEPSMPRARPAARAAAVEARPERMAGERAEGRSPETNFDPPAGKPLAAKPAPRQPVTFVEEGGVPPVFTGDWPGLAASLSLKGLAQQLAYQSELARVVANTIHLRAPVAAITEAGVVERLQQALSEHFGQPVRVQCEVGAVVETAAAADAEAREQRQREAEASIDGDPFVQGLLREFGGQIVPGSIQPRVG